MDKIILNLVETTTNETSSKIRGNSMSVRFKKYSYITEVNGEKTGKNIGQIHVYHQVNNIKTYDGGAIYDNDIIFVKSNLEGAGDSLEQFFNLRRNGDLVIRKTKGFVFYKGKLYIAKITEGETTHNGTNIFDITKWETSYSCELEKEIVLPKEKIVQIKKEYKDGEKYYVWDGNKQEYLLK